MLDLSDADAILQVASSTYNSSTSYLESNLKAQWEDNIRMFNNKHPSGSKYNNELYKKRSHIFRPKTRTANIHFTSDLSRAFFSTSEYARVLPEDEGNELAVAGAKVVNDLLSHHLTKTLPWHKLVVGAGSEAWKMGNCISHQGWAYEVSGDGETKTDEPKITLIPAENFRIDESADWLDPVGTSPYIIWIEYLYVTDIRARVAMGADGGWLPVTEDELLAARDFKWEGVNVERQPNQATTTDPRALKDHDLVPVHHYFIRDNFEEIIFSTLATDTLLAAPALITDKYPTDERPFAMGSLDVSPFTVYHQGIPELAQPLQEEANSVANDRLDNVHLVLNKRYFAKRGRNVDFRSLLRNISGSITTMDDPVEDVRVVETSDVTQSSYLEQTKLDTDFDDMVGTFSPVVQQQAGQASGGAVGGMNMAQAGAAGVTEFQLTCFRETWVEPVIRQLVMLILDMESEQTIKAVVRDKEALEILISQLDMPLEEFLLGLRVNVNVGISATSPQVRVEKLLYALGAITKVEESEASRKLNMQEITTEIFGQLGYRDGERFFDQTVEESPEVRKLKEMVAQLEQQLQSKMAEIQAKNEVPLKELEFEAFKYQNEQAARDAEFAKTQHDALRVLAEIDQIYNEIAMSQEADLDLAKLQLDYDKLKQQQYEFSTKTKTERDKILVDWKKSREDLSAKLEIVKENNKVNDGDIGKGVSNDTATTSDNAVKEFAAND